MKVSMNLLVTTFVAIAATHVHAEGDPHQPSDSSSIRGSRREALPGTTFRTTPPPGREQARKALEEMAGSCDVGTSQPRPASRFDPALTEALEDLALTETELSLSELQSAVGALGALGRWGTLRVIYDHSQQLVARMKRVERTSANASPNVNLAVFAPAMVQSALDADAYDIRAAVVEAAARERTQGALQLLRFIETVERSSLAAEVRRALRS